MVSDAPLDERVVIADANVVFQLYQSLVLDGEAVDASRLEGRRALRLWLYWHNPTWEPYVRDGRLAELKLTQATQVGRFYPAVGDKPPFVVLPGFGKWPRRVSDDALQTLEANGVPVRLDSEDGSIWLEVGMVVAGVIAAPLLLLAVRRRRTSAIS